MVTLELSLDHLQLRKPIASYSEITLNSVLRACKRLLLAHWSEKYGKTTCKTRNHAGNGLATNHTKP